VLLLLGAAHEVSLWVGQCAFAIAAILLWINTPDDDGSNRAAPRPPHRAGGAMMVALLAAIGQAVLLQRVGDENRRIAAAVSMAATISVLAAAVRLAGSTIAARLAGWLAVFGLLFSLGSLSLVHLVPRMIEYSQTGSTTIFQRVGYGFGAFAWEATLMIGATALICGQQRIPMIAQRVIGTILLIAGAFLMAWRLSLR